MCKSQVWNQKIKKSELEIWNKINMFRTSYSEPNKNCDSKPTIYYVPNQWFRTLQKIVVQNLVYVPNEWFRTLQKIVVQNLVCILVWNHDSVYIQYKYNNEVTIAYIYIFILEFIVCIEIINIKVVENSEGLGQMIYIKSYFFCEAATLVAGGKTWASSEE